MSRASLRLLRRGLPLLSLLPVHVATSTAYSQPAHRPSALLTHDPPRRVLSPPRSKIWKKIKQWVKAACDLLRILKRMLRMTCCFAPALASAPLLLLDRPTLHRSWWEIFRRSIWAAGPCLTKFSQWAATRPDIFPAHLCDQLSQLQCNTEPHSWRESEGTLRRAFGDKWERVLQLDASACVGSGLVAQVYKGTLRGEGESRNVAVKVLHPGVKEALEDDLALLSILVSWLEHLTSWGESMLLGAGVESGQGVVASVFSMSESVEEFRDLMMWQLDLEREGKALEKFKNNFKGSKWSDRVIFPSPIPNSTIRSLSESSEQVRDEKSSDVLVETFQHGIPMTEILERKRAEELQQHSKGPYSEKQYSWSPLSQREEKAIAALGMDIILKMIFDDNYIHGDLHPGNMLLVRQPEKPDKFQLVLLDTGIYSELNEVDRKNFIDLFKAVIDDDGARAAKLMIERSRAIEMPNGLKVKLEPVKQSEFEDKMSELVHKARTKGLMLGQEGVSGLLQNVLRLCYEHRVRLEPHFVSVILSVAIIEGLGRRLDPDIDLVGRAAPFIAKAAMKSAFA